MKVKSKTISVYISEDGTQHEDHLSAVMYDLIDIISNPPREEGAERDGTATVLDAAARVFKNRIQISNLMKSYSKIEAQKRVE